MGPEKNKQEKPDQKPAAQPHRADQTGVTQPSQSVWGEQEAGNVIKPPPDAVPKADPDRQK